MKKTIYITPQIYVVKLHQQALMQYASPAATPRVQTEEASDPDWTEDGYYNL
ncbi:MAG: hypothetical protein IKN75_10050 [Prevotella sp.]|nr:hypothetical protein [Prevotella sp.]